MQNYLFLVDELVLEIRFDIDATLIYRFGHEWGRETGFLVSRIRSDEAGWWSTKRRSQSRINGSVGSQRRASVARWQRHGFRGAIRSFDGYSRKWTAHRFNGHRLSVNDVVRINVAMWGIVRTSSFRFLAVHQTERAEFVPDVSTCDGIVAKLKSIFHFRIRVDFFVTLEIATLSIGYENVVDYRFDRLSTENLGDSAGA